VGWATVFVKGVDPGHKDLIKLTSGLLHEPRLFNAITESGLQFPLEHPTVDTAVIDETNEGFILVMEDLRVRATDTERCHLPVDR
jgi:hypothetical protein